MKSITDRMLEIADVLEKHGIALDAADIMYLTVYSVDTAHVTVRDSGLPKLIAALGFEPSVAGSDECQWHRWYRADATASWDRDYLILGDQKIQFDWFPDTPAVAPSVEPIALDESPKPIVLSDGTTVDSEPF